VDLLAPGQPPVRKSGAVSFVTPDVDTESQTVLVKATSTTGMKPFAPTRWSLARFVLDQDPALSVPMEAVNVKAVQAFVFRVMAANAAVRSTLKGDPSVPSAVAEPLETLPSDTFWWLLKRPSPWG